MRHIRLLRTSAAIAVLLTTACHHEKVEAKAGAPNQKVPAAPPAAAAKPVPTAADIEVARNAMPVSEVLLELRSGISKQQVLADVRKRHVTSLIVPQNELELSLFGAGAELIAALKDPTNLLTPLQEDAYMQLVAQHAAGAAKKPVRSAAAR